jgi:hypothetical protein
MTPGIQNPEKSNTHSAALVSAQEIAKIRTNESRCAEGTYVRVPLEVLVDEPEGSDDGYDGKETRYDPPYIMRYNDPTQTTHDQYMGSRNTWGRQTDSSPSHCTYLGIRPCRAGKEKVPSPGPWA